MSRRGEFLNAAGWTALGTVIVVASWRMDRLADRGINPWSAPGLTPGVVGALMVLLGLVLAVQARGRRPDAVEDGEAAGAPAGPGAVGRTLLALVLCIAFAGVSLGHGLPFVVEGAAFIFVFTTLFSLPTWRAEGRIGRALLQTAAIAIAASFAISWLFESVFLVRLP
ncbi:MAG: tripartite tricarboxylate transporter TctB family protein [Burkholderiaceae bacterium]